MTIKIAACMLALLSAPILASAQGSSPASPATAPAVSPPNHAWPSRPGITPADLAQGKAFLAAAIAIGQRQRALMESSRANLFAAITPAHREAVAQIIGELAMSSNPDANAAAKQIDAALSPAEKAAVIAADQASRAQTAALRTQMAAQRAQYLSFRKHEDAERAAAGWPTPSMAKRPTTPPPAIHKNWKTRAPDAGWYLVVAAQYGPRIRGIVMAPTRWNWFDGTPFPAGTGDSYPVTPRLRAVH